MQQQNKGASAPFSFDDDLKTVTLYDEATDTLAIRTDYDSTPVLALNAAQRNAAPETGRYRGNLVHVARIHLGDIERLKNMGFNLMSPDPDERKRALLYIQAEEKAHLTMPGTPIARKKLSWM